MTTASSSPSIPHSYVKLHTEGPANSHAMAYVNMINAGKKSRTPITVNMPAEKLSPAITMVLAPTLQPVAQVNEATLTGKVTQLPTPTSSTSEVLIAQLPPTEMAAVQILEIPTVSEPVKMEAPQIEIEQPASTEETPAVQAKEEQEKEIEQKPTINKWLTIAAIITGCAMFALTMSLKNRMGF